MFFKDLIRLLFPKYCCHCGDVLSSSDAFVCTSCLSQLPLTDFCSTHPNELNENLLFVPLLNRATSLFYFHKKSAVQSLIHQIKYHQKPEIGKWLGHWLGEQMKQHQYNIDIVIPVPLHKEKLKKRGYNQVSLFGKEIATILEADFREDLLIRSLKGDSQTHKNRENRYNSVKSAFDVENGTILANKNILIVDDVITTGATLEACARAISKVCPLSLNVASIACVI